MPTASMRLRVGLIVALVSLSLAIAFVAQKLHAGSADAGAGSGSWYVALVLMLVSLAVLGYLLLALARDKAGESAAARNEAAQALLETAAATAPKPVDLRPSYSVLPSPEAGHLVATGALIRRLCHELNNALGPIQGFAELLGNDQRIGEAQRRQVTKIGEATAAAQSAVQDFAAALTWSKDHATAVNLGAMTRAAAAAAQAAIGRPIAVTLPPGRDIQITATEVETGQAILHLCAALTPLIAERDVRLEIAVDSAVGAARSSLGDGAASGQRLQIWSDPFDPEHARVQLGLLQSSWRYGRVQLTCVGHGWSRDLASRLFVADLTEEHHPSCLSMTVLGGLMLDLGGVVMIDTCPLRQLTVTLLWPARIPSEVAAPLETDTTEDDLDALIIHAAEPAAEELSRRLGGFGLRVASTTSPEAGLDLIAEMGARCRAILLGDTPDAALLEKILAIRPSAVVLTLEAEPGTTLEGQEAWQIDPDREALGRLAARLRRGGTLPPEGWDAAS
ncbi:MAG TPA: hypothetical protein PLR41_03750 [Alphaproteobacteria bacterium]|nr:hypothetical protein [Alphaproteobacteria bacterium]